MKIVVTSPSFSKNNTLQNEIRKYFLDVTLNLEGTKFDKASLIEFLKDADGIIVGLEKIDKDVLSYLPKLKIISKYGVGLNNIDLDTCNTKGIALGWTGGVNRLSVAEMTLGYMLMLCRNIYMTSNQLKDGIWKKDGGSLLSGKTIGIIGVGYIGKELVRLLEPFDCKILVNDIIDQHKYYKEKSLIESTKEEIFSMSDIITIHTPFNHTTQNMINDAVFKQMKKTAFVINSARGGIVDENDLKVALKKRLIAGAAIDAYIEEPPMDKELLLLPNLICTPHIGGNAIEAVEDMGLSAINHLREFFKQ